MHRITGSIIQGLIVILLLALIGLQLLLAPGVVQQFEDVGLGASPFSIVVAIGSVLFVLCVEVALVCVWRLVSFVKAESIFTDRAFAWVDVIVVATLTATGIVALVSVPLFWEPGVPPAVPIAGSVAALFGLGLALVVTVMRALLRQAVRLEDELAEVV